MFTIENKEAVEALRTLADGSVQLVVTSPPYDNLREYKIDKKVIWRSNVSHEEKEAAIKILIACGVKPITAS